MELAHKDALANDESTEWNMTFSYSKSQRMALNKPDKKNQRIVKLLCPWITIWSGHVIIIIIM